jgi:hypothetical protein
MRSLAPARRQSFDQLSQLAGRPEPSGGSFISNSTREPTRVTLTAELPKNPRQLIGAGLVDQLRRRQSLAPVHSHVQRPIKLKTEAAVWRIQLRRTHAQVHQNPITTRHRYPIGQLGKVGLAQFEPARERGQALPNRIKGYAIAIAPIQPPTRRTPRQNGFRVSTPTERRVYVTTGGGQPQRQQRFLQHHRDVSKFWHYALSGIGSHFANPESPAIRLGAWLQRAGRFRLLKRLNFLLGVTGGRPRGWNHFQITFTQVISNHLDTIQR